MAAQPIDNHELYSDDTSGSAPVVPAGLRIPPVDRQAPVHTEPIAGVGRAPVMWLLGAHGGAGVSTLARVWAPAADAHGGWPAHDRYRSVIVVARTHRTGLAAAHDLLLQSAAGLTGGCTVLGLALVPDAPGSCRRRCGAAPTSWRPPRPRCGTCRGCRTCACTPTPISRCGHRPNRTLHLLAGCDR